MESSQVEVNELLTYLLNEIKTKCPFNFEGNVNVSEHLGRFYFNQRYEHLTKKDIYLEIDYEMQVIMVTLNIGKFFITTSMFINQKYPNLEYPNFGKKYVDFLIKYFIKLCHSEEVKVGDYKRLYKEKNMNVKEFIYGNRALSKDEK